MSDETAARIAEALERIAQAMETQCVIGEEMLSELRQNRIATAPDFSPVGAQRVQTANKARKYRTTCADCGLAQRGEGWTPCINGRANHNFYDGFEGDPPGACLYCGLTREQAGGTQEGCQVTPFAGRLHRFSPVPPEPQAPAPGSQGQPRCVHCSISKTALGRGDDWNYCEHSPNFRHKFPPITGTDSKEAPDDKTTAKEQN